VADDSSSPDAAGPAMGGPRLMKRDYYEVLGVPRDAELQQIKKAYRKLARQHHPDVACDSPDSEEKFKEATEAYEVLCDSEKRNLYDTYGHDGLRRGAGGAGGFDFDGLSGFGDLFANLFGGAFDGGAFGGAPFGATQQRGPARGDDLAIEVELTLEEAAFGLEKEIAFTAQGVCPECEGAGTTDPSSVKTCSECGGRGQLRTVRRTMLGQFIQTGVCLRCSGTGQVIEDPCPLCRGAGRRPAERKVTVQIPAGIDQGQRIRVTGKGGAGERGARGGDLYVHIRVAPHELFERRGDDILTGVDLTMVQAALGTTLGLPTLDGDEEVEFAPGTQPGEVKVLRNKGVQHLNGHGRGDQAITVRVVVPRDLDESQRHMLEQFDDVVGAEHYAERSEGVLHKLRSFFTG
jgi:molecular chaperone DnaJ